MTIRVRLNPITTRVAPARGAPFTVVTGCTVTLESRGSGPPPPDADAVLEFFEVPHRGDASTQPRLIASLDGRFAMQGTIPTFDARLNQFQYDPLVADSDFSLSMNFDAANFQAAMVTGSLFLPWEVDGEGVKQEVGVKLKLGTSVHSDIGDNDKLDIPLHHRGVPEDGTDASSLLDHSGITMVYPPDNFMLRGGARPQRIPIGSNPLRIFLHDSVETGCNSIHSNSFDLPAITGKLQTIMGSGGFTTVQVSQVTTAQATAGPWRRSGGRFIAKNVADPLSVAADEGQDIPFFEYWVFLEAGVQSQRGEAGDSESLNPFALFNATAVTKRVITPIVLMGGGGAFDTTYQNVVGADQRHNFIADIITHEIGHSLGLRHGVRFDSASSSYSMSGGSPKGAMTTLLVSGGRIPLKKFGPVHALTIRRHFL